MRVLIADDSATNRLLMAHLVEGCGHTAVQVEDGEAAWRVLQEDDPPRIVLIDWLMPGLDGPDVCRLVRNAGTMRSPYIVLVTSQDGKQQVIEGLNAGADDFVAKPFHAGELRARLEVGQRFIDLQDSLLSAYQELEVLACTDVLTGLANRRSILARLAEEQRRAWRERSELSVGIFDVDHFKYVNDELGHAAGDTVLKEICTRAAAALGPFDSMGRFGGEEFLIVMPRTDARDIAGVLGRVRAAVGSTPIRLGDRELRVTVSIGGATGVDLAIDELIAQADQALYEAKGAGRDCVVAGRPVDLELLLTEYGQAV